MSTIDILTSVFLKILKGGNMVRITDNKNNNRKVGILVNIDNVKYKAIFKSMDNNFIGELFTTKNMDEEIIDFSKYSLTMITKKEFQNFRNITENAMEKEINPDVKEMYKRVLYRIDENIRNTATIQSNVLKVGYKMYPSNKIEIFNKLMNSNVYINEEIPKTFNIANVVAKMSGKKKGIKKKLHIK